MAQGLTRVVIFAKAPVAGAVKTRLIPALGADGAAALAVRMLKATVAEAVESGLEVELCVSPDADAPQWRSLLPSVSVTDQGGGDLGQRLSRAAERVIGDGRAVLLIGTDCPQLGASALREAAARLDDHDAVLVPALDGGYVLLGLNRFDARVFDGITWSTSVVAAQTTERIAALGWSLHVGTPMRDIDEPADLAFVD